MVEQCRPLSEWIGIFSPIFSDIATQKSMADRSERIEWQSKLIVSSGATHCVSVRRRVCEAHRRVPCLGVKWDKGRKRRRADEWKWKEGADEKLFGGRRRQRHRSTQLFFPPFSRRSIILVGRIKKNHFNDSKFSDFSHWLPEFRRIFWLVAGKKIEKKFGKNLEKSLTHVKSLVKCLLTHSTTLNDFTTFLSFFKTIFSFEKFRNKSEKNIQKILKNIFIHS